MSAGEFARKFRRYHGEAHREAAKVTSDGRMVGEFLSLPDLEHFEHLKGPDREVLVVGELPADVVADIEAAENCAGPG